MTAPGGAVTARKGRSSGARRPPGRCRRRRGPAASPSSRARQGAVVAVAGLRCRCSTDAVTVARRAASPPHGRPSAGGHRRAASRRVRGRSGRRSEAWPSRARGRAGGGARRVGEAGRSAPHLPWSTCRPEPAVTVCQTAVKVTVAVYRPGATEVGTWSTPKTPSHLSGTDRHASRVGREDLRDVKAVDERCVVGGRDVRDLRGRCPEPGSAVRPVRPAWMPGKEPVRTDERTGHDRGGEAQVPGAASR